LINLLRHVGIGDDHFPPSKHSISVGPINIALAAGVYLTLAPILLPRVLDVVPHGKISYGSQNTTQGKYLLDKLTATIAVVHNQ